MKKPLKLSLCLSSILFVSACASESDDPAEKQEDEKRICEKEINQSYDQFVASYNDVREEESSGNDQLFADKIKAAKGSASQFLDTYSESHSCAAVANEEDIFGESTRSKVEESLEQLNKDEAELSAFISSDESKLRDRNLICRPEFNEAFDGFISDMSSFEADLKAEVDALNKMIDEKVKDKTAIIEEMNSITAIYDDKVKRYESFMASFDVDAPCYTDDSKEEVIRISRVSDLGKSQADQKLAIDSLQASVDRYLAVL